MYVCRYVGIYRYLGMYIGRTGMEVHRYVCVHVCMYVCMYACIVVYIYTHTYTYWGLRLRVSGFKGCRV